ncbi:hypothetical protein GCM10027176_03540 [Actinoallomurus bryophytorum]|uniref:Uncharacterized protein n=1 Tax=Actinoallomurus bryophytorum TaxID=1490222 RepID=A0A543CJT2_9ACTN|nr:hypothetical protein [Actinoallomurus bryophytorum]TQL97372.1 hypothetical protein FB559_2952 [Actinoallomurus bryophytorum]
MVPAGELEAFDARVAAAGGGRRPAGGRGPAAVRPGTSRCRRTAGSRQERQVRVEGHRPPGVTWCRRAWNVCRLAHDAVDSGDLLFAVLDDPAKRTSELMGLPPA